jgi:tRNA (Thr-GGU) A37 N-methylase
MSSLSVAKLERIDGSTVVLSGIDLVHGTPIRK